MLFSLEELLSLGALLFVLLFLFILIELHYIFAFKLVQKTQIYTEKTAQIKKIKKYFFLFLHLSFALIFMLIVFFSLNYLQEGYSLKALLYEYWAKIPQGFWLEFLYSLIHIAVLIVTFRIILKKLYIFLDKKEAQTLEKNNYKANYVKAFYERVHKSLKFIVVFGIVYRITHFFPFLALLSDVLGLFLIAYVCLSLFFVWQSFRVMRKVKKTFP